MKRLTFFSFFFLCITTSFTFAQKKYSLRSPDGKIEIKVGVDKEKIQYALSHEGTEMIVDSPIALLFEEGDGFGVNPKVAKVRTKTVDKKISTTIYKKKEIEDRYNELTIQFKGGYDLVFRAYDDGIAYRFVYTQNKPLVIQDEIAKFNLPSDQKVYISYSKARRKDGSIESQFYSAFQNTYTHLNVSEWDNKRISYAPIVIEANNGKKLCITEADLMDYPGMYLWNSDNSLSIKGVFATYPKAEKIAVRGLSGEVTERESFIAKVDGPTAFPWRTIIVAEEDHELANSDMVYKLASASKVEDTSWIKPGKVAWDWWNNWNLYGVDFETGINNETYKYYIDFASKNGIEYVILDEGWSVPNIADLYQVVPEIDLDGLIAYAKERNVGIVLWAGYYGFNKDIEGICKHYSAKGVKGFKLDFMDRDDQKMVKFHKDAAAIAAKYNLLVNFHGSYKPTGLQRTYPNVLNFEGVHGLEEMKWAADSIDQVEYDVTMPFIRMVAGPLDYTQGAMRNAIKKNYKPIYTEPMSQGTRCRQLALYVILESPLNMLCDSPSNYKKEQECTDFITAIPTVWDETVALNGKIGEYVSVARRSGDVWYVASLTDWNNRELNLDLSFLTDGEYEVEIFEDGMNADKVASDYKKTYLKLPSSKRLSAKMTKGGGYIAKLTRIR